jgi:DNA polymerase V
MNDIVTALAEYTQEAVTRMRAEQLSCRYISVIIMTNAFTVGDQYANQATTELPYPSSYLPEIQTAATELLKRIFRSGYKYRKVMICLNALTNDTTPQLDLFDTTHNRHKALEPLMQSFDQINERYGRGTIKLATGLLGKKPQDEEAAPWNMKREYLSPCYTTNIAEIPVISA